MGAAGQHDRPPVRLTRPRRPPTRATSTSARAASFRPEITVDGRATRVLADQTAAVDPTRHGEHVGHLRLDELASALVPVRDRAADRPCSGLTVFGIASAATYRHPVVLVSTALAAACVAGIVLSARSPGAVHTELTRMAHTASPDTVAAPQVLRHPR